jgi:hypothetical protein
MTAPRVTAHGLGTPRNGLRERKDYVYGATRPRRPESSGDIAEPSEIVRRIREQIAARLGEPSCPACAYPPGSIGHETLCGGQG